MYVCVVGVGKGVKTDLHREAVYVCVCGGCWKGCEDRPSQGGHVCMCVWWVLVLLHIESC